VREVFPHASERRVCRLLSVPRSAMSERRTATQKEPTTDHLLTTRIEELIRKHPAFGYRRLWAILRFRDGLLVNRMTVYRILKVKGWFCHERRQTPRPRVRGLRSRAERSNQRWAMDVTHVDCEAGSGRSLYRPLRDYRLGQEFITPYTPEQNGMIERLFRSLKGERV